MASGPPERIELNSLLLRRFSLGDVAALSAAVEESIDELKPWMPWARDEPLSPKQRAAFLSESIRRWDDCVSFEYAILDESGLIGACALVVLDAPRSFSIGYWVRTGSAARGVATAAAGALTAAAFSISGVESVEIHHDKANVASGAIPDKLGYKSVGEVAHSIDAPGQSGVSCIWRVTRDS
jgi:RimJ/RimL family protein N-acetyltransferase